MPPLRPASFLLALLQLAALSLAAVARHPLAPGGRRLAGALGLQSAKEAKFKRHTKVVLVLGTGCNATFFDYDLERSCSIDFEENYAHQPWRHAKPPCDSLPAVNKTAELEMGWLELYATDYRMAYTAVLRRAVPFLQQMGWEQLEVVAYKSDEERLHVPSADVVIAPQTEFERELQARYCNKQFIVVQTDDWATVSPTLDVNSPQILGVLMHDSFTDLSENNLPSPYMVRHNHWMMTPERLASLGPDQLWQRDPPITEANLRAKVHTIIPQIMRWMHPLDCGGNPEFVMLRENALGLNPNFSIPLHERSIDITFVGVVDKQWKMPMEQSQPHNGSVIWTETMRARTGVMEHRQFAIDRILELRDKYGLNVVTQRGHDKYANFVELLRDTKVFVSPFGIGEFSGKDYEALMAGALVAKPMLRSYESYPNIYSSRYMLDTKVDFSDLERVVMPYLQDESKLRSLGQERVDKAQKLLDKYSRMGPFVGHLDELLYKMLQQEEFTGAARQKEGCYHSLIKPRAMIIPKFLAPAPPPMPPSPPLMPPPPSPPSSPGRPPAPGRPEAFGQYMLEI
eukprot:jgi/Tetstr1/449360/TSEL_003872.t1